MKGAPRPQPPEAPPQDTFQSISQKTHLRSHHRKQMENVVLPTELCRASRPTPGGLFVPHGASGWCPVNRTAGPRFSPRPGRWVPWSVSGSEHPQLCPVHRAGDLPPRPGASRRWDGHHLAGFHWGGSWALPPFRTFSGRQRHCLGPAPTKQEACPGRSRGARPMSWSRKHPWSRLMLPAHAQLRCC